jgi:hypothetical protein
MTILFGIEISTSGFICHPDRSVAKWRDLLVSLPFHEFSRKL